MIRKKIITIAMTGIVLISLTACGNINKDNNKYGTLSKELWKDIKYSKYTVPKNEKEEKDVKKVLDSLLYEYKTVDSVKNHNINIETKTVEQVSKEEALKDIDYLFNDLKFSYGCYQYFGGDGSFDDVKTKIKAKVKTDNIKVSELEDILLKELEFIKDNKFLINDKSIAPSKKYISNDELNILKDNKGYYIEENNKKLYMKYAENDAIEKNIKTTLDDNGDVKYVLGKLSVNKSEDMTINLYDGVGFSKKTVKLQYKEPQSFDDTLFKLTKYNNINVIESRRLNAKSEEEKKNLNSSIKSVKSLSEEKYIIVDLRGNKGGNDPYPSNWIGDMTEGLLSSNMVWAELKSKTVADLKGLPKDSMPEKGECKVTMDIGKESKIKTRVVVFLDDNIKASGEILVNSLKYLDDVIFVGTNTKGEMLTTNMLQDHLPNSHIKINYGSCIGFNTHFNNIDGEGFQPQIWINDNTITDKVIKFLDKNKFDVK